MGAYGHRSEKPTVCFGTASEPKPSHALKKHGLRPWIPELKKKMTEKDKQRIKRAKADTTQAMVRKTRDEHGNVKSVPLGGRS